MFINAIILKKLNKNVLIGESLTVNGDGILNNFIFSSTDGNNYIQAPDENNTLYSLQPIHIVGKDNFNNPITSFSEDEQKSALRFFRSNEHFVEIPYRKILNFKKFADIADSETAANHILMFGELSPEWVKRTPRITGLKTPPELIKHIGKQILDNGFFIGSIVSRCCESFCCTTK